MLIILTVNTNLFIPITKNLKIYCLNVKVYIIGYIFNISITYNSSTFNHKKGQVYFYLFNLNKKFK